MHGSREGNARLFHALVEAVSDSLSNVDVAICVPFPFVAQAQGELQETSILWGVQDVSPNAQGAFTGEVGAAMVAEFGCRYAIVGHSERRIYHGEDSAVIAMKARRAIESGLIPILCVGETLAERESGLTERVVGAQIENIFGQLSIAEARQLAVAYEPLWAIGSGITAPPTEAQRVHAHIRNVLRGRDPGLAALPLLYGGSVKASNAAELLSQRDIDGALVGGASLNTDEFSSICRTAQEMATKLSVREPSTHVRSS